MEHGCEVLVKWWLMGKLTYFERNFLTVTLPSINQTGTALKLNPHLEGKMLPSNHLNPDTCLCDERFILVTEDFFCSVFQVCIIFADKTAVFKSANMAGEAEAVYRPPERCNSVSCWAAGTGCWIFLLEVSGSWSVPTHRTLLGHHLTCPSKGQLHESWSRLWPDTGGWWMDQVTVQVNIWFPGNFLFLVLLLWCFGPFLNHGFPVARVSRQFSFFCWGCQSHDRPLSLSGTVPKTCPAEMAFLAARLLSAHLLSLLVCVGSLTWLNIPSASLRYQQREYSEHYVWLTQMKIAVCDSEIEIELKSNLRLNHSGFGDAVKCEGLRSSLVPSAMLVPSAWIIQHSL